MKLIGALLSLALLVPFALLADDSKCGCNKPRPVKPGTTKEMPKPAPVVKAEADQPDCQRDPEVQA